MRIVVVGGYGAVGSMISEKLSLIYPDQVVIAGRNLRKAQDLAARLENKAIPFQFDVRRVVDSDFWNDVKVVIMCLDQTDTRFIEFCIDKGIHYIDISANYSILQQIEKLHSKAQDKGSNVLLSVGLAPGLTNLLAQHGMNQLENTNTIDLFVLLGLGEKHGDHAFEWTFDNFHTEYTVQGNRVKSFTNPKTTYLEGEKDFYLFDFADQHVLSDAAKEVRTRLAFDINFMNKTVGLLRKIGLTKIFKNKKVQKFLIPLFKTLSLGSDVYGVKAVVTDSSGKTIESSISGYGEGEVTAQVAANTVIYLMNNPVKSGVSHLHDVIKDIPAFIRKLDTKATIA